MLYIITPCSRPEKLADVSKTIPDQTKWIVVKDPTTEVDNIENASIITCKDTGMWGTKARNFALDTIPLKDEDNILFHDDDNIIHPNWYREVLPFLDQDFSILTWGQLNKDGSIRLKPSSAPKVSFVDTASYLIKWKYNKHVRHQFIYTHDGFYAEDCSKNGKIICLNKYICYYNYLR